jgi:CRISPR-associated endoribonuclease Cas6
MVIEMRNSSIYSVDIYLMPDKDATVPVAGYQIHGSFLDVVGQIDPSLSARLHDEPGYRPYTLSPLSGGVIMGEHVTLRKGRPCRLRITLFDGGILLDALQTHFGTAESIVMHLGGIDFRLIKMHVTPGLIPPRLAGSTDWQTLLTIPAQPTITMHFCTATAFSLGERQFCLFPEPSLVWGSLLRTWNRYAPVRMHMEKQTIQESLDWHIAVTACKLQHDFLHFPTYVQKGFVGHCTYHLNSDQELAKHLTTLSAFAQYAGVGYKTTMGMGQVYVEFGKTPSNYPSQRVKHNYFL